jgi:osmotically inducible protein OsmC
MKRTATGRWQGDGTTGKGDLTTQSGTLKNQPYSFNTRFESQDGTAGTNPEELLAAAHAGCFTMALSFVLAGAGFTADTLKTDAEVEIQKLDTGFAITHIQLNLTASIPNIDEAKFLEYAETAKQNCPLSKALAQVPISLNAKLETST